MALPERYVLTWAADDIAKACYRLGRELAAWAQAPEEGGAGKALLTIPILRGGLFFYADLVRAIDCSVELVTASASSYDVSANAQRADGQFRASFENIDLHGRRVLLVDDICDSGRTLARLKSEFLGRGALEVRTAALIRRVVPDAPHVPDYVGFVYDGPEWFVGYGMDDKGEYRNLPAVYRMKPGV
jgi:hypoxanthine phosphoribosyltransferase